MWAFILTYTLYTYMCICSFDTEPSFFSSTFLLIFFILSIHMESSSQVNGDSEECSSSESGWTMYLASPMHDDGGDDDRDADGDGELEEEAREDNNNIGGFNKGKGDEDDDDDSMASDASSGPVHSQLKHIKLEKESKGKRNHKVEIKKDEKVTKDSKKKKKGATSFHGITKGRKTKSEK